MKRIIFIRPEKADEKNVFSFLCLALTVSFLFGGLLLLRTSKTTDESTLSAPTVEVITQKQTLEALVSQYVERNGDVCVFDESFLKKAEV